MDSGFLGNPPNLFWERQIPVSGKSVVFGSVFGKKLEQNIIRKGKVLLCERKITKVDVKSAH